MPQFIVLSERDITKIIDEAMTVLEKTGLYVGSPRILQKISLHPGMKVSGDRVRFLRSGIEGALKTAPSEIQVFRQDRIEPLHLSGDRVHFVADSVMPYIWDAKTQAIRDPFSKDLIEHIQVLNRCDCIDFQSGSLVLNDVAKPIASSYRYYLSLLHSPKPMFGGAFGLDDLRVIRDLLAVIAGGEKELERRPGAVIATNPSSPLGLTDIVAENLVYCAEQGLPAMLIPIPLAGGSSPVTLAGTLVQHTAENLGSLAVSQMVRSGAPVIFGGGPSIMDMRKGTACQASSEAVLMGAAIGQIAKRLNLPSATNTGRADSKVVDYQAGEESGVALVLMALAGLNMIRGPGSLEYANVVSKEKLLIDNEICGMAKRMTMGVDTSDEALATDVIAQRATSSDGYLSASHTLQWFRKEFFTPSNLIDRGTRREFEEKGGLDAYQRVVREVEKILASPPTWQPNAEKKKELDRIMLAHARKHGMDHLPLL